MSYIVTVKKDWIPGSRSSLLFFLSFYFMFLKKTLFVGMITARFGVGTEQLFTSTSQLYNLLGSFVPPPRKKTCLAPFPQKIKK